MWPIIDRCPTLDRDSPRRKNGNAVSNPRIRACSPTSLGPAFSSARSIRVQELHDEPSWRRESVRCVLDWGHQNGMIRPYVAAQLRRSLAIVEASELLRLGWVS